MKSCIIKEGLLLVSTEIILYIIFILIQPQCEPCIDKLDCPPCISSSQIGLISIGVILFFIYIYRFYKCLKLKHKNKH